MNAKALLNRYFLDMRSHLLELAAAFDRLDRADGSADVEDDFRLRKLREGVKALSEAGRERAERVQMIFSDPFDPAWVKDLG